MKPLLDKKLINRICKGMSKEEKAFLMLAVLMTNHPYDFIDKIIPLQEMNYPKGNVYYADLKYGIKSN